MKKIHPLRESLGLSQQDMASLLGVTRSLYSLYELGRRSLPHAASMLEAELTLHVNAPKAAAKMASDAEKQTVTQKHLAKLIRHNELKQRRIEKALTALRASRETATRQLHLDSFAGAKGVALHAAAKEFIKAGASAKLGDRAAARLFDLEVKQQVLAFERQLLDAKMAE
jgi:transcriptional regulator with XRE-family HTH domain